MKTLLLSAMIALAAAPSFASEYERSAPANDNFVRKSGELSDLVIASRAQVQKKIGANLVMDMNSLDCLSRNVRGNEAGACIVNAISKSDPTTYAVYAILIGEADENGGIHIRSIDFLKQSN